MSVRKAHNSGRNHLRNVVDYYQRQSMPAKERRGLLTKSLEIGHEKAQSVIDSITSSYAAEGQSSSNPMLGQNPGVHPPPPFGFPGGMSTLSPIQHHLHILRRLCVLPYMNKRANSWLGAPPPFPIPGMPLPPLGALPPGMIPPPGGRGMPPMPPFPGGPGAPPFPIPGMPFPPPGGLPPNFQMPPLPGGFQPPPGFPPMLGAPPGFPGHDQGQDRR
jgi:U1 small nuclear ribonucleoprotein C